MTRNNLILVRAGDASQHRRWLPKEGVSRSWDLLVSYYGTLGDKRFAQDGEYYHEYMGGCWTGNAAALDQIGELVEAYDYIAFANDDMYASSSGWDRLFNLCKAYEVDFGHPSVPFNSLAVLKPQPIPLRVVSRLPDINVPVLSRRAIKAVRHTFVESEIGLALMHIWPHLCPTYKTAIVDSAPVEHTRALGKGDRVEFEKRTGIDGEEEMKSLLFKYNLKRFGMLE